MSFLQSNLFSVIAFFLLAIPHPASALCDFENRTCINIEAQSTTSFSFTPLFASSPSFVYVYESITAEEAANLTLTSSDSLPGPETKWGLWLDYDPKSTNLNRSAHYTTTLGLLFAGRNTTLPDPSGGHNGCEGSLGQKCAQGLTDAFKAYLATASVKNLYFAWRDYFSLHNNLPGNYSCPVDIFDDFAPRYTTEDFSIARENGDFTKTTPPGNSSFIYLDNTELNTSFEDQHNHIAVGMMLRVSDITSMSDQADEIQLEIVCMRATPTTPSESTASATATATATEAGAAATKTGAAMRVRPGAAVAATVGGLWMYWGLV